MNCIFPSPVHHFFLFPSPTPNPYSKNVSFVSRPWRMVDSSVNGQVCKGMLEGVLCHIMSRPGITQQTLMEHFEPVLQPTALLDLVQVRKHSAQTQTDAALLSEAAGASVFLINLSPLIMCVLGKFQEHLVVVFCFFVFFYN